MLSEHINVEKIKALDNEFNNLILSDLEPLTVSQKLQFEDKCKISRRNVVILISKFEYHHALLKCKELILYSKKLFFNEPFKYFYSYLTDSLLLAKCFIREDKFTQAEEVLVQGWKIFNKYVTTDQYRISKIIFEERDDQDLEALQKYINTAAELEDTSELSKERDRIKSNLTIIKELKRRTSLLACYASLFYNIGCIKTAEEIYVIYVQMIEQNYGLQSLEASNCYYLVGIFYLENSYLKKSMACMKKALEIRLSQLGSNHSAISDCYYNIGLIFYILGDRVKSNNWILDALQIRLNINGPENMYVAKIYEMQAQLALDDKDYTEAFNKLKKSMDIKTIIYTDPEHQEIQRTKAQLKDLAGKLGITEEMISNAAKKGKQDNNPKLPPPLISAGKKIDVPDSGPTIQPIRSGGSIAGQNDPKQQPKKSISQQPQQPAGTGTGAPVANKGAKPGLSIQEPEKKPQLVVAAQEDPKTQANPIQQAKIVGKFGGKNKIEEDEDEDDEDSSSGSDEVESEIQASLKRHKNDVEDVPEGKIAVDRTFNDSLSGLQKAQLKRLENLVFEKGCYDDKYDPLIDVINSEFFNSLTPKHRDRFRVLNKKLFEK